ncbi:MAG TPA: hypothetical protein VNT60_04545 [Deinococcales bacterium]|nr:hypothetical protein [Deinococcales bacterium]
MRPAIPARPASKPLQPSSEPSQPAYRAARIIEQVRRSVQWPPRPSERPKVTAPPAVQPRPAARTYPSTVDPRIRQILRERTGR